MNILCFLMVLVIVLFIIYIFKKDNSAKALVLPIKNASSPSCCNPFVSNEPFPDETIAFRGEIYPDIDKPFLIIDDISRYN